MNNHVPVDLVPLGKIVKPHGILGEVKIRLFNSESKTLKVGQSVWVDLGGKEHKLFVVERLSLKCEKSRLKFKNINDRNSAELLKNFTFSVCRDELPETVKEEFYLIVKNIWNRF